MKAFSHYENTKKNSWAKFEFQEDIHYISINEANKTNLKIYIKPIHPRIYSNRRIIS